MLSCLYVTSALASEIHPCLILLRNRLLLSATCCGKLRFIEPVAPPEDILNTHLEVLEAEALKLAPADRSHLLGRLIASLDLDPEVEETWALEADRREAELESGTTVAVPGQEAIARLRTRLAR